MCDIKPLKYYNYDIVFQEVPNEITLAFNITGCPYRCEGCHSPYLWEDIGNLLSEDIDDLIRKYKKLNITCVAMMGGDQNPTELNLLLKKIKNKYHLKTCLYTGTDDIFSIFDMTVYLDYLKIGHYDLSLGGLSSKNTNQKFYKNVDGNLIEITDVFQK